MIYIFAPLYTALVAYAGSRFTDMGMGWYRALIVPVNVIVPDGKIIGLVWTIIFILATISAILAYRAVADKEERGRVVFLYFVNGVFNILWSYLFFFNGMIGWAVIEAALLAASVLTIIYAVWKYSRAAAYLLAPYFLWVCFATYLTYSFWAIN